LGEFLKAGSDSGKIESGLAEPLCELFGASVGLFFRWNEETKDWSLTYHRGMPKDFGKNGQISRAWQSLPTIVMQDGGVLFSSDLSKDPRFIGQIIKSFRVKSFAGVSLKTSDKLLGVLGLGFGTLNGLARGEEEELRQAAELAGLMLDRSASQKPTQESGTKQTVPPENAISWVSNRAGKILSASEGAVNFLGYPKEQLTKMFLSDLMSRKAAHLLQTKIKRGPAQSAPPTEVEIKRGGKETSALRIRVEPVRQQGRPALRFLAENVTSPERQERELLQKSRQLELLEVLFASLGKAYTLEEVFETVLNKLLDLTGFDGGYILEFDQRKQRLFLSVQKGISSERVNRLTKQGIRHGEGISGRVMETGEPYFLAADRQAGLKKKEVGEEGLRSYACVPVPVEGQVWGTLSIFSPTKSFDREDLRWLGAAGRAVGYAVENARVFEEARRRVADLTIMNNVSQSITRSLHLEMLLATVVDSFTRMINASTCFIMLIDDKRNLLYGAAASGRHNGFFKKTEIKLNENALAVLTVKERRSFTVENASKDPRTNKKLVEHFKTKSLLSVPLIIKEKVIGVVLLDETRYYRNFTDEEVKRVTALAGQVAVAIENANLYQAVTKHIERLQTLSSAIVNIQEEERRRIARELHDETAQALTSIKMNIEAVEKEVARLAGEGVEQVLTRIGEVKNQLIETVDELRRLSYDLRPAILDDMGLIPTLRWYAEDFSKRTGVSVHLHVAEQQKRFPPKIEILFYRIVQEALTNVAKHAQAESVAISLERKDLTASLYITDDGKGFEVKRYFSSAPGSRRGLGILGMKERVELNGGTFYIDSEPGEGTRISIRVPIMKRN
jgi:PAS domain S-box-containing protein